MTFEVLFCVHWTQRLYPNAIIVRETEQGVELTKHNGQLGLAYRELGEPLVIRRTGPWIGGDKLTRARELANRIDVWARTGEDPDGPEAFYAELRQRLAERAPA